MSSQPAEVPPVSLPPTTWQSISPEVRKWLLVGALGIPALLLLWIAFSRNTSESKSVPDQRIQQLIGTWRNGEEGTFTLNADSTLTADMKTGNWGILAPSRTRITGSWKVSGDYVIFHIKHSTYSNDTLAGVQLSERILGIDKFSFKTIDEKGKVCTYNRQ